MLQRFRRRDSDGRQNTLDPIHAEILGAERLETEARALAVRHAVDEGGGRRSPLLPRLESNTRVLRDSYRALIEAVQADQAISPAAEWLIDNVHIVEENIRVVRDALPGAYDRELPKLLGGRFREHPRVYAIAHAYVAHTDSRFEPESLERMTRGYQREAPLTMGELWALPIMVRIALIENLRRLAESIVKGRAARAEANALADLLLEAARGKGDLDTLVAMLRPHEQRPLDGPFTVTLVRRLREADPAVMPVLAWLEDRFAEQGTNSDDVVRKEHLWQLAAHATTVNLFTSLRRISAHDWSDFFERVSIVERILRRDPTRIYGQMDFATRDTYRHAIEELARGSGTTETSVAERVLDRAHRAGVASSGDRATGGRDRYLGYHLIRGGRRAFERDLGFRTPVKRWITRAYTRAATPLYLGVMSVLTVLLVALVVSFLGSLGVSGAVLVTLALLAAIPASDLAIAVLHRDISELLVPRRLPKLDLRSGIPEPYSTMVAIPTIVATEDMARAQVAQLERHYLAGAAGHVALVLLSDGPDADHETLPDDDRLVATLADGLHELNRRHGPRPDGGPRFLLLHRRRVWNESEQKWMGWERKRGKIHELNAYLRGDQNTTYITRGDGLTDVPEDVQFVATLDADTRLAPGTLYRLVGAIAHPLNRPRYDPDTGRVETGYGILQPRVTPVLPAYREGSLYHRIYAGPTGIDPYSSATSDVYQDLFNEASYVGKGIYDIDAFEIALEDRVPENTLLSHDLFEGSFARTGLVSDTEVFDDFPTHLETNSRRVHRWARGDWQLLPWIVGHVPTVNGHRRPIKLPLINRWKMVDNLRRTLSPCATTALLVAGWLWVPLPALEWSAMVLILIGLPHAFPVVTGLLPRHHGVAKRSHVRGIALDTVQALTRAGLALTFVANRAIVMADAIVRTLARLASRKRLLEWVTAAQAGRGVATSVYGMYRRMWRPVGLALGAAVVVGLVHARALPGATPVLVLWLTSPAIAFALSRPRRRPKAEELSQAEIARLRRIGRKTWSFFEVVVGDEDNWLPPDNFQEDPEPVTAYRTSPTNIGMYLLSTLAARDFGWIGHAEMLKRVSDTFDTLDRMQRHRGHFYNWYDTRTLEPLEPRYVSTVDSGNLAGHLLAIGTACREELADDALTRRWAGVADTIDLALAAARAADLDTAPREITRSDFELVVGALEAARATEPATQDAWVARLVEIGEVAEELADVARLLDDRDLVRWSELTVAVAASHQADFEPSEDRQAVADRRRAELGRSLAARAEAIADAMEFDFLYDRSRHLFPIGYQVAEGRHDAGYYDLLASEARLTSLVAIAKKDVPVDHWFHLGRPVTPVGRSSALLSWSGSMFEYLMPYLVIDAAPGTLIERTQRLIVGRQIRYGRERGVPWGISESAYNARDLALNYQYSHFGVPGLGLTRGLSEDVVVSPYATALALMVDPGAALDNLERLSRIGAEGEFGFYEALDYTPDRVPKTKSFAIVRAYMTHHQGMTLVAIGNVVHGGVMRDRFHAVPSIAAAELLLQERIPRDVSVARPRREEVKAARRVRDSVPSVVRRFHTPHTDQPQSQMLSNGRYSVMITNAGAGCSRWNGTAVTRWREDATRDSWGSFMYVRDVGTGDVWSIGYQPTAAEPDHYEVVFAEDRAEIIRRDGAVWTSMEVVVSPEDDAELRRVTIKNLGGGTREIELTTYAEVVLTSPASDEAHPAFQKLFVQTEYLPLFGALLATRRPREQDDPEVWAAHVVTTEGEAVGALQYETDRARFLDRGRGVRRPSCVAEGRPLSNTTGAVLDPILSLRRTVRLGPGETARLVFSTFVAQSREALLALVDKYRDASTFEREASLAWTQAQVQLKHFGIEADEAHLFQRVGGSLLYLDAGMRAIAAAIERNRLNQTSLWPLAISGDLPIVLVRIDQMRDREIVRQLMRAHEYWVWKGLEVDLVVVNEHAVSYAEELQDWLERELRVREQRLGSTGESGIHVLRADQLSSEELDLLRTVARVSLHGHNGSLTEQLAARPERAVPLAEPVHREARSEAPISPPRPRLAFFNGLGGFAEGGKEYVTILGAGQWTPAPWVNVIANERFGFVVSESGSGYTWSENSRENRLTPWSNDPVADPPGEVLYIRDEDSGDVWSPTPLPIRTSSPFEIRHGQGWSSFRVQSSEIESTLLQYVALEDPIKISRLTLRNVGRVARRLSVTAYVEWVLGFSRQTNAPFIVTERDPETGALFARNSWNREFGDRVAFVDMNGEHKEWTGDRAEVLGRHGTLRRPAALDHSEPLSGRLGGGLDPCCALRDVVTLAPGDEHEVVLLLGQAEDTEAARALVAEYRVADLDAVYDRVVAWWEDTLGALQVRTPDYSMAIMLNRWLLYQALSCRVWARSAFYQSGGAFGFRDQLQDVMALVTARRDIARQHLLRAASRQFEAGDVQHWWHPPTGRGVRTAITDDRVWLPFAVLHYIETTGDRSILDEEIGFLDGRQLENGESEAYFEPSLTTTTASMFEHCARALDVSLKVGRHGLPLIGAGDWNDGMNRVGHEGRGESVWLAWFLHIALTGMIPLAEERGDRARVERWRAYLDTLEPAIADHGWDGAWYRRAFFDDGTPLGSSANEECKIDSIAQSWAVLSGAARPDRAEQAMKAVEQYLVHRGDGLVLLFAPPFDQTPLDPGYIKGYVPGVRENGGQYTHAAIWSVLAFAELGDGDKAAELFSILNPINHGSTRAGIHRYKVEPYVAVADVYAQPPHVGRGGWTWYTGSAGWMYRAGIEWILGFRLQGAVLTLDPCIPRDWPGFEISFRYHSSSYEVVVENPSGMMRGVRKVELDGVEIPGEGAHIDLVDDGATHVVRVVLGQQY